MTIPSTGDQAPTFEATSTAGSIKLSDTKGHKLVIFFYPKDNTPGCTTETEGFRDNHELFRQAGCYVVGVSRDSLKSHDSFSKKLGLNFPLIADTESTLCESFGVIKEKNMYGRKVMGIERSTFLIDGNGVVVRAWRGVKVPGHVQEVLEAARAL
jgi:thioredoxin-dependent peroxiredoxin